MSDKNEIDDLWVKIKGKPDILANIAGIYPFQKYLEIDKKSLEKVMDINFNSMFWMCQNFIREREDRGGIIVNISSIEAILPFKEDLIPYAMSKSGVISLTRSVARDYGKKGFRANVIVPGGVKTKGTESLAKEALMKMQINLLKADYFLTKG